MGDYKTAFRPIGSEALTFDGKTQYRSIPSSSEINFARDQDFTVAVQVCPDPVQPSQQNVDPGMVEKWDAYGRYPFALRYYARGAEQGKIYAGRYDETNFPTVMSKSLLNDRKFHHVAFVRRTQNGKGVLELYVDGALEASTPDTTAGDTRNGSALYLGCRGLRGGTGMNYFAGQIKDLQIYGAALSPAEIAGLARPQPQASGKPNLLLIVADDLGADALRINDATGEVTVQLDGPNGTTGPKRLPNLEKLVKHGMHFSRAWAQPVCSATRGSLFTGMQPWRSGVGYPDPGGNNTLVMNPRSGAAVRSLAEVLKGADYRCGMFGKWHMGKPDAERPPTKPAGGKKNDPKRTAWDWGWERFEGILEGGFRVVAPKYGYPQATMPLGKLASVNPEAKDPNDPREVAFAKKRDAVRTRTTEYLRRVAPEFVERQPDIQFYVWEKCYEDDPTGVMLYDRPPTERTHMYATRDQVYSAKEWIAQMLGSPWCVALTLTTPHDPFHVPPRESYTIRFANPEKPTVQEMFVAMVESMDFYIGQLLSSPEPEIQEQLKNTVIVFIGDNGTQDEDPDRPGVLLDSDEQDKATPHIGAVHVPMIIADGGSLLAGTPCYLAGAAIRGSSGDLVHILDIFRTCADIAGASAREAVDSVSLKPYLRGGSVEKREFNFSQQFGYHKMQGGRTTNKFALVSDGRYLLSCARSKFNDSDVTDEYTYTLYELVPHETIVGALREKKIESFLTDATHRAVAQRLYDEMKRHHLDGGDEKEQRGPLPFPPLFAYRYVRLLAKSEVNGGPWTSAADFQVLVNGKPLDRSAWTVTVDSEETAGENGRGQNAIDGTSASIWHTEWYSRCPAHPHWLSVDLKSPQAISGFKYLPRQNQANGRIADYEFQVSSDGQSWVTLCAGRFPDGTAEQTVDVQLANERSIRGTVAVKATFRNNGSVPLDYVWVDYAGAEKKYGTIAPRSQVVQDTYETHVWRLKDGARTVATYVPTTEPNPVFSYGNSP
ncbi:uncharacterized protein SOCE836_061250 [Sorangium cellulosum]|uniref:F5/8 type C domain-containing protein n=2 Tax=Sorangium TaxID=39643 RepID=A0A4P2QUA1_SORCE|nr:sulfatase-like hydrolase/transferase [Sorangium cellulosum]AUX33957.1 uncharacterized protein SOCE836_061250 [Sorangium cellulosum]WCQ93267.1 hypothetical protein NQZ70_06015 [Sorangium sp. Soce836]